MFEYNLGCLEYIDIYSKCGKTVKAITESQEEAINVFDDGVNRIQEILSVGQLFSFFICK